ncbi:MAG: [FeFe] hydrogenase H-cluster maturation GTPase HydF, partial [Oscillospiraceae bacterium]|nr:[FeFe] hydrogenase H-cluster maturation GTPase HydF [Oscillospiraceae bacterium]
LPQQQTIRDILESGGISIVVKETELAETLKKLGTPPKMVITDSQAFGMVNKIVPKDILLTSFSILFARYKGNLETAVRGAKALDGLKDGDKILISEGCTHHRQCGDIGTVKLPAWINKHTCADVSINFTSGTEFPDDLSGYSAVIHCGGCMLNEREMKYRYKCAEDQGVPITNYGIAIAYMHGILKRSVEPFEDIRKILE